MKTRISGLHEKVQAVPGIMSDLLRRHEETDRYVGRGQSVTISRGEMVLVEPLYGSGEDIWERRTIPVTVRKIGPFFVGALDETVVIEGPAVVSQASPNIVSDLKARYCARFDRSVILPILTTLLIGVMFIGKSTDAASVPTLLMALGIPAASLVMAFLKRQRISAPRADPAEDFPRSLRRDRSCGRSQLVRC